MKRRSAFTLVEVLVVVAVLAALTGLLIPVSRNLVAQGQTTQCLQNLRQIGTALQLYLGENQMRMPVMEAGRADKSEEVPVLDTVLAPYLDDLRVFSCPSDRSLFTSTGNSYFWNSALNGQPIAALNFLLFIEDKSKIPLVCDKEGWHKLSRTRVNFLYADGHATEELQVFTLP